MTIGPIRWLIRSWLLVQYDGWYVYDYWSNTMADTFISREIQLFQPICKQKLQVWAKKNWVTSSYWKQHNFLSRMIVMIMHFSATHIVLFYVRALNKYFVKLMTWWILIKVLLFYNNVLPVFLYFCWCLDMTLNCTHKKCSRNIIVTNLFTLYSLLLVALSFSQYSLSLVAFCCTQFSLSPVALFCWNTEKQPVNKFYFTVYIMYILLRTKKILGVLICTNECPFCGDIILP